MENAVLLQNVSVEELIELIGKVFDTKIKELQNGQNTKTENEDLITREQLLDLLKINSSTLWHWQNSGKIIAYKFANKCYYKKSEVLAGLTLNK